MPATSAAMTDETKPTHSAHPRESGGPGRMTQALQFAPGFPLSRARPLRRHGRAFPPSRPRLLASPKRAKAGRGHPRLAALQVSKTWMAGTRPAMTVESRQHHTPLTPAKAGVQGE